jgi:SAM-dependent methyltransferase
MPEFFDKLYGKDPDPWGFEDRPYEQAKYADTLASLPRPRYHNAFEIGCSIGVLTTKLAERCDAVLAVDGSTLPLERAHERCRSLPNVQIAQMLVPQQFPSGSFDLILVSEVAYYWSPADLARAQSLMLEHLEPGGHLILVHWLPQDSEYPLNGDEVHESFLALPGLRHIHGHRAELYRLDLLERV